MALSVGGYGMLSPEVCKLLSYWRSIGGGDSIPDKALLDLRKLTSIMPWMFILEMSGDGALVYRLAGSALEGALGQGMAGETSLSIFAEKEYGAILEEIYAVCLVQGCGVLRTGSFSIDTENKKNLETLCLPFIDSRAMGGCIFVGVVRPFLYENDLFSNKCGTIEEDINQLFFIPSPRVIDQSHLSKRVKKGINAHDAQVCLLDTDKVIELDGQGVNDPHMDIPSKPLHFLQRNTQTH